MTTSEQISSDKDVSLPVNSNLRKLAIKPPHVRVAVPELNDKSGVFLLDTGSDTNIVSLSSFCEKSKLEIDKTHIFKLVGATPNSSTMTQGVVKLHIQGRKHDFQVCPEMIGIKEDGILGSQFFTENEVNIDYKNRKLTYEGQVIEFERPDFLATFKMSSYTKRIRIIERKLLIQTKSLIRENFLKFQSSL